MRQIHLKCPYCLKEGNVPIDKVKRFVNLNRVEEPVSLPCGACAAMRASQPGQGQERSRLWNWFDRVTRYSIIAKIVVAMIPMTALVGIVGYKMNVIENHPVVAFVIMILLFCEGLFTLGLLIDIPYDYSYDVVLNPAFKRWKGNAWHKREIGHL